MPSDDPVDSGVDDGPAGPPATGGKGWSSWSKNKKLGVVAGGGVIVGVAVYLYAKHKSSATTATGTSGGLAAPTLVTPTDVAPGTGGYTGGGSSGGGGGADLSSFLTQLDQDIAGNTAALNDLSNLPSGAVTNNYYNSTSSAGAGTGTSASGGAPGGQPTVGQSTEPSGIQPIGAGTFTLNGKSYKSTPGSFIYDGSYYYGVDRQEANSIKTGLVSNPVSPGAGKFVKEPVPAH